MKFQGELPFVFCPA